MVRIHSGELVLVLVLGLQRVSGLDRPNDVVLGLERSKTLIPAQLILSLKNKRGPRIQREGQTTGFLKLVGRRDSRVGGGGGGAAAPGSRWLGVASPELCRELTLPAAAPVAPGSQPPTGDARVCRRMTACTAHVASPRQPRGLGIFSFRLRPNHQREKPPAGCYPGNQLCSVDGRPTRFRLEALYTVSVSCT